MIQAHSTWLLGGLLSSTLHALTTFVVAFVIDRMLQHRMPHLRSWLWRVFYVKVAMVGALQLALSYPRFDQPQDQLASVTPSETFLLGSDSFATLTVPAPVIEASTIRFSESVFVPETLGAFFSFNASGSPEWTILVALWCIGVCVCIVRLILQWSNASQIRRRTRRLNGLVSHSYMESLSPLSRKCTALQLRLSTEECSPYLVGILRPFIVLPNRWLNTGLAGSKVSERVRMILAHELAHLHRRDLIWNLFVCVVHVLLYFHPVLWVTRKRYYAAQEAACDELAIRKAKLNPVRYAELLIEVSHRASTAYASPAIVPLIVCKPRKILFERLRAMQTYQFSTRPSWTRCTAVAIGFLLAVLPWSVVVERSAIAQGIALEDSSGAPSSKKPSKSKRSMSSASASAGAIGISGGSSSGSGNTGGFRFQSNVQTSAVAEASDDKNDRKKRPQSSSQSPNGSKSSSEVRTQTSSTRSTSMSVSREINEDGDTIKIIVQEPNRQIFLTQSSEEGIEVKMIPKRKGSNAKETRVLAEDAEDLKKKDSKAYAVYRKYMEPQLKGNGTSVVTISSQSVDASNAVNDAQKMMRKQLEEMQKNEALDPAVREQLEGLIDNLPKQD